MAEFRRGLPRLVIFDLDGTLVDTVPDIAVALNAALTDLQFPAVSADDVRRWVGNGARVLCGRAISRSAVDKADPELASELLSHFLDRYAERACAESRLYDGAARLLEWLGEQDVKLAIATNKPLRHTEILLDALSLRSRFELVLGGDSAPRKKPDPAALHECLRHFALKPQDALMVGDSENDIEAARAAGIDSVCVTYGYNQGRDIHELGANLVIESLAELIHHLEPQTA